ncbi:MAG: Mur ligase family protein, partial [Bryobacteraceae bacterium]
MKRFELWMRQVLVGRVLRSCVPLVFALAWLWRRLLWRTTFIAVTGSLGKTTTTRLLAGILSTRGRTFHTVGNQNGGVLMPLNILRVRPWHRYAVIELGIDRPGAMLHPAMTVRPDVAVILDVAEVHTTGFDDLEQYTAEKAKLLDALAPGGLAVLNGDDPRVAGMAGRRHHRICLFGRSPEFDVWVEQGCSRWPERLRLLAHAGSRSFPIQTRLLGEHWMGPISAALAVTTRLGVDLEEAARAIERVQPYTARMDPIELPNGAVIVRDDYNGTVATSEASLKFLREVRAGRRLLIVTDISDSGTNRNSRLRWLAQAVSGWLDLLVIVGKSQAYGVRKAIEQGMRPDHVQGFDD